MSKWETTSTAELISAGALEIGDGYRAKNAEFETEGGLPFVRVGDIQNTIDLTVTDQLPTRSANMYGRKVSQPHDSLITMKGTVGRVAYVGPTLPPFVYSPQVSYWRSHKHEILHPRWLRYWLESPEFRHQASATKGATDMADYINLRDQRRMTLTLPPPQIQERIANVLGTLDDLIENSRRRVEVLEGMSRAVYHEWFVKFRYPGHEEIPLADSPLGPIPEGWTAQQVSDITAVVARGISPKYADDGQWVVLNQRCIRDGRVSFGPSRRQERSVSDAKRIRSGDVLINSTGVGTLGRVAMYRGTEDYVTVDSHVTICRPSDNSLNPWFAMALSAKQNEIEQLGTGATGQTELRRADVGGLELIHPPTSVIESFAAVIRPLLTQVDVLLASVEATSALRDRLLPKIVTGQIDVSTLDSDEVLSTSSNGEDSPTVEGGVV